jgi:hypothetical protein
LPARQFSSRERLELFSTLPLGPEEAGEEDAPAALEIIGDYRAIFELEAQRCFDELGRHFEQRPGKRDQLFGREPAMPFVHRLRKGVGNPRTYADESRLLDAKLGGDLAGGAEADAADVTRQAIWVFCDELNGTIGYDLDHFQPAACAAAIASMYSTPLTFNRAGTPPKSRPPHIDAYRALFTVPARDRTTVALFPAQRRAFHEAQHWLVGAEQI